MTTDATTTSRLDKLLAFLKQDPGNPRLLADAAEEGLKARRPQVALDCLAALEGAETLSPSHRNLRAAALMAVDEFEAAADILLELLGDAPDDPNLRFNLAWAKSIMGDHRAVVNLIDRDVAASIPRAAALKVQAHHHLGELAEALAWGKACADGTPEDSDLMSALSVAALDDDDTESARQFALKAGDTHEGLSTLGMLALSDQDTAEAGAYFDRALAANPNSARALLGQGLSQLLNGESRTAAAMIDQSAALFVDHLGTWISAGWAHFAHGDQAAARDRFERALAMDDTFAESHGALAVMDIAAGDLDSARRRTDIALRLDRACLSGALARSLLLTADGRTELAERVRATALNTPIDGSGQTLASAMARFGRVAGPPQRTPKG